MAEPILRSVQSKLCPKCGQTKLSEAFSLGRSRKDGLAHWCKTCNSAYKKGLIQDEDWLKARKAKDKIRYEADKERRLEKAKTYRESNVEAVRAAKKVSYQKKKAEYIKRIKATANSPRGRELRNKWVSLYSKRRRAEDPVYVLKRRMYSIVNSAFKDAGFKKSSRTHEVLGCDWGTFKTHIERQFLPGMSWARMGPDIHIDHIVPMATANSAAEVAALNHFTNLRPLWAVDNIRKNAQITHLI